MADTFSLCPSRQDIEGGGTRGECRSDSHATPLRLLRQASKRMQWHAATARGFEPLRAEPNGFLVHHLSHSVTLSVIEGRQQKNPCKLCQEMSLPIGSGS